VLDELVQENSTSPGFFAFIYAGLDDNDRAFEWLEKGLAKHDPALLYLKLEPGWDPIRDDPRFADLISRIPYYNEN
jgi:serine/threonine-protein kinase